MAEKTRYRGMPTSVPAVPGARGAYPLPKPVAAILMNLSFRGHLFPSDSSGKSYAGGKLPSFPHPVNDDPLVKSQKCPRIVIPVKTGIQRF